MQHNPEIFNLQSHGNDNGKLKFYGLAVLEVLTQLFKQQAQKVKRIITTSVKGRK